MDDRLHRRVQDLLADAEAELGRRAWARARALAGAALVLDPDNADARRLADATDWTPDPGGEWRQLSVMFCDMVGSTGLSEQLTGEAYRDVILRYQRVCDEVIGRHGGFIAKYQGDGVLAYFGHPVVHEDDAHRGVRAGLELPTSFAPVAEAIKRDHGVDVAVRIAVHTGMVVLSDMGTPRAPEPAAITGEAPNLAARLQDHAKPNSLVISGSTYELVRGFFVAERRGPVQLKGLSRPVEIYDVVGEGLADTRLDAAPNLSPFVGRAAEIEELEALWRAVADGGSATALIVGDPGIGKSRLADVLRRRISDRGASTLVAWCSPQRTASNLWAVRRLVEYACAVSPRSNPEDALRRVQRALAVDGQDAALPLFASLLELPPQPWSPAPELAPAALRQATMEAVITWIKRAATREPRLVVVDDLQWADPSTLELLHRVIASKAPGLMLVMTSREGVQLPWSDSATTTIRLGPLAPDELQLVAAASAAGKGIDPDGLQDVIARSDGVPLYFEELLVVAGRAVDASRPVTVPWKHDLPPSLIGPLLARVQAPGVDMRVAQTMAVIGHEVPSDILGAVAGLPADELEQAVGALEKAGIIDRVPPSDEEDGAPPTYRFRHRLLWELVYDMQLLPARVARHAKVADTIIERAGGLDQADGAVLGPHLEQAVRTADAILAYANAARTNLGQGADTEVDTVLAHGFALLDAVTDEETRLTVELPLLQLRALAAMTREGYLSSTAIADQERSLEICQRLPSRPDRLPAALGVWGYYILRGELDRADDVLDAQLEGMGPVVAEAWPGIDVEAGCRQLISFFRGELTTMFRQTRAYLASPHPLMDDASGPFIVPNWPNPTDPVSITLAHAGVASVFMGRWEEAEAELRRGERRLEEWPFPYGAFTRGNVAVMRAVAQREIGDLTASSATAADVTAIGDRHGFTFWSLAGNMGSAIDATRAGDEGAVDRTAALLDVWRFTGIDVWMPYFLTQFAMALIERDPAEALVLLEEGTAIAQRTGAHFYSAETERCTGLARLGLGDDTGLGHLAASVKIAEEQGTRLFELRARTAVRLHAPSEEDGRSLAAVLAEVEAGGSLDSPLAPVADLEAARAALST